MARRIEHLGLELDDLEVLAILEQMVKIAAVGLEIARVEHRPEDPLHVLDLLADADLCPGLGLYVGRAGEVVGMGMRLKRPQDGVLLLPDDPEQAGNPAVAPHRQRA